jgi:two-component system cell cycle sensor histidine kinase/response regulator CckA
MAPAAAYILAVDDEPSICEFLSRLLGDAGYRVKTTTHPVEALRVAEADGRPDLLLTDLKMPMMDGDALAARVREIHPDIPVLFLTGFSEQLFRDKGVLRDREAFLDKPASPMAVLEAVEMLLKPPAPPTPPPASEPNKPGIMWFSSLKQGLLALNVSGRHR